MDKVWKDHPMFGKRLTFRDGSGSFEADVIDVKAGPMLVTMDMSAESLPMSGTIKLRIKPVDGRGAFWTPPMQYAEPQA